MQNPTISRVFLF